MEIAYQNQKQFKKILESLTYPGRPVEFKGYRYYRGDLSNKIIEFCISLVDGDVSLSILGDYEESFKEISVRTNVCQAPPDKADYIVVPKTELDKLAKTILEAKRGTYIEPDNSATIIAEVDFGSQGQELTFQGPGIDGEIVTHISNVEDWMYARNKANSDFPMGVDIFFVSDNKIMALARTTKVKVAGE